MLKLLDVNKFIRSSKIKKITSPQMIDRNGAYSQGGLFAPEIFGEEGSPSWNNDFGYLELNCQIVHPKVLSIFKRLDRKLYELLLCNKTYSIDKKGLLQEDENGEYIGISSFIQLISGKTKFKLRGGTSERDKMIIFIKKNAIFVSKLLVIPPKFRGLVVQEGKVKFGDELNDYYVRIINAASKVKSVSASSYMYKFVVANVQNLTNKLFDFASEKMAKKTGFIRTSSLGKRVDFSGRAVITGNPRIPPDSVGLPIYMAVKLFEPFIIHSIIHNVASQEEIDEIKKSAVPKYGNVFNIDAVKSYLSAVSKGIISGGKKEKEFLRDYITKYAIEDRVVLLKRDPALHRLNLQAFKPIPTIDYTLEINPFIVDGFNADFDGDQMAVYMLLTDEAQQEAKEKMLAPYTTASMNSISMGPGQNLNAGIYALTKDADKGDSSVILEPVNFETVKDIMKLLVEYEYKFNKAIKIGGKTTTIGKFIFSKMLPNGFQYNDETINKKKFKKIIHTIQFNFGNDILIKFLHRIGQLCFKVASIVGSSIYLDLLSNKNDIKEIVKQIKNTKNMNVKEKLVQKLEAKLKNSIKEKFPDFADFVASGASKGWTQIRQAIGMKGAVQSIDGSVKFIDNSTTDGFTPKNFFDSGGPARGGMADRALNTADTGYLTRKLVYAMSSVKLSKTIRDCKTKKYLVFKVEPNLVDKIYGRYRVDDKGNLLLINSENADELIGKTIKLRSPLFCKSKEICKICYGELAKVLHTFDVGIAAGQTIGERGTQLIMQCSDGLVQVDGMLIPFEDLYNMVYENKITKFKVSTKEGLVEAEKITKHKPTDEMLFISTKSGHSLICQANHPLWVKKNSIHPKYDNKYCRLIGEETYTEIKSTRKLFKTDDELIELPEARDLKKYDAVWIDNSMMLNAPDKITPEIDGYSVGVYCSEGSRFGNHCDSNIRKTRGYRISQHNNTIKSEMVLRFEQEFDDVRVFEKHFDVVDNDYRINKTLLGDYTNEKRLKFDFILYSKEWLKDFISGLIDGAGSVFTNTSTCCRIWATSYYLVQQCVAIAHKLGYKVQVGVNRHIGENSGEFKRNHTLFFVDYRFTKYPKLNSIKLNNHGNIVLCKIRKEKVIKGFDIITNIMVLKKWDKYVYDVKTPNAQYMINGVMNHNTFHCFDKNMTIFIELNDEKKLFTFEMLWNFLIEFGLKSKELNGEEIIDIHNLHIKVWDKDKWTKPTHIRRHKQSKNTTMCITRSKGSDFVVCQDNHPIMLSKHAGGEFSAIEPKEDIENKFFMSVGIPIWENAQHISKMDIDPYVLGIKIVEEKSALPMNYFKYSDKILSKLICGIMDRASIVDRTSSYMEIDSSVLAYQLHTILDKLNIRHNIALTKITDNVRKQIYIIKIYPLENFAKAFKYSVKFSNLYLNKNARKCFNNMVDYKQEVYFDKAPMVYDLTTETGTLNVNGVWCHNTGGAVSSIFPDIYKSIPKNNPEVKADDIKKLFKQDEDKIHAVKNIDIYVDFGELDKTDFVYNYEEKYYSFPTVDISMYINGRQLDLFLNNGCKIYYDEKIMDDQQILKFSVKAGDIAIRLEKKLSSMRDKMKDVLGLIEKKNKMKSPIALLFEFFEIYKDQDLDLIHYEIVISELMRDKQDMSKPARLVEPYNPVCVGIKKLPYFQSWLLGMMFENINKSIETGLIHGVHENNSLTDIFVGNI